MADFGRRADRPLLGASLLLPGVVEALAMSAKRPTARPLRHVVRLDVVPLGAFVVVVMHRLAGARRVPRSLLSHLASPQLLIDRGREYDKGQRRSLPPRDSSRQES